MSESAVDVSTSEPAMHGEGQELALREIVQRLERIQQDITQVKADVARFLGANSANVKSVRPPPRLAQPLEHEIKLDLNSDHNDELPRQCIDPLKWLASKRISVRRIATSSDLDGAFDQLSLFLGERFANVQPFYAAVKRRVAGSPYPRSLNMTEFPATMRGDICTFAMRLHANGFLSQYHYHKSNRALVFDPQPDGRVTNFFTGEWLERYVLLTAVKRAESRLPESQHPSTTSRVVVELPDRLETELDILLGLPDRVLWLECKTGDWQNHAMKFGRVARHMGIPAGQAALVLLEPLSPSEKKSASALSNMTVINPQELEGFIESALTNAPSAAVAVQPPSVSVVKSAKGVAKSELKTTEVSRSSGSDYSACLAKRGLRPLAPEMRTQVVQDLVRLMKAQPLPFHELAKALRGEYKANGTAISASQLSDVATAMRRSGLCQRLNLPDYPSTVFLLRSDVTVDEALHRCSQLYLWSLLKNPAWSTHRHLDAGQLSRLLNGNSDVDPARWLADLCQTLAADGKCIRKDSAYIAVGEHFDVGAEQADA